VSKQSPLFDVRVHEIVATFDGRVMGYSKDKRNYLHPEELLHLIEQGKAVLTADGTEETREWPSNAAALLLARMRCAWALRMEEQG
jgi:hypothetical protein